MGKYINQIIILVGFMLAVGIFSTAFAFVINEKRDLSAKIPKNMSQLSLRTDDSMTIYLDGVQIGKTQGNQVEFLYNTTPGNHEVKAVNSSGATFVKIYSFVKKLKTCICLKTVSEGPHSNCPFNIFVTGPEKVLEGDLIAFAAFDSVGRAANLKYVWKVTPANVRITSGLGTPMITVDTTGLFGQTITAELEVTDCVTDEMCRQRKSTITQIELPDITIRNPQLDPQFDEFNFTNFDDIKFRLDNLAIELQNRPDAITYILVYQGNKPSKNIVDGNRIIKRTIDYLVKKRGISPNRVVIKNVGNNVETKAVIYIIAAGAKPPF